MPATNWLPSMATFGNPSVDGNGAMAVTGPAYCEFYFTNYIADLPSDAVIVGLELAFTRAKSASVASNGQVVIVSSGQQTGTPKADGVWSSSERVVFGSSTDKWNADLTRNLFYGGFAVSLTCYTQGATTLTVSSAEMRIHYTSGSNPGEPTPPASTRRAPRSVFVQ